jgi:DNA (cytosine-5)-methyltransferase 1
VTASLDVGDRRNQVHAFLTAYYGSDAQGQAVTAPMRTVTTRDRLGLVLVEGGERPIVDIGMRMLEPHELLAAQFGRFAKEYDLSAAETKSAKVRLIGNSVCPEVAEAVVRANVPATMHGQAAA